MRIIDSAVLVDGHEILLVETASSGGGAWAQSVRLALVETDGTQYRHARAQNVIRTIDVTVADGRHKGPRSGHAAVVARLRERMLREVEWYRPCTTTRVEG